MSEPTAKSTPEGSTAMGQERIERVTIGLPTRLDGQVTLSDYDPAWPLLFAREADRIRDVLGERVLLLEHVGSTSVPGLMAKPIIDMVLAVADSADEASYVEELEAAGYVLRIREPDWHEHRLLKGPDADVNLHVFTAGSAEIYRNLLFRDRLRANRQDRELYARTKRELAARTWKYVQNYADAKSDIIEEILLRAGKPRMSDPAGFEYRTHSNGDVLIVHRGRPATTLRGAAAARFLDDVEDDDPQELMARVTGNYRHGNERTAGQHPRNAPR